MKAQVIGSVLIPGLEVIEGGVEPQEIPTYIDGVMLAMITTFIIGTAQHLVYYAIKS